MRPHPRLDIFKTMQFGFKRVDFLAFFLFPRVWKEIDRLNREALLLRDKHKKMVESLFEYTEDDE